MQTARSALAVVGVLSVIGLAHMGSAVSATSADDRARAVAEEMAQAASKEFNAFENRQRVAQADTSKPGKTTTAPQQSGGPWQWLRESRERFQALMRRLAGDQRPTQPWDPVADAGRKGAEPPAKAAEAKKAETPPPAASKPAQVAGAKPPAEERKLAEARRGEADKAETPKGKAPPAKTEAAKPAETPKAADAKPKAADAKPAAEAAKPPAPKTAEAPRAPAKDAVTKAPESAPPAASDSKKAETPKPAEAPKQDTAAKKAEPAPKVATAPPASTPPAAKPEAAPPKAAAPAAPPAVKPETPAKAAEAPKASAPAAKQEPAAKQTAPAKQPSAGDKVAANEPPAAKTDTPSGIPTEAKAPPRLKGKGRSQARTAATCSAAGRRVSAGDWYTVREGDSLWRIARRHLGDGKNYQMLRTANRRAISDADQIRPCQRIYIPRRAARRPS